MRSVSRAHVRPLRAVRSLAFVIVVAAACTEARPRDDAPVPAYDDGVGALLTARCATCHAGVEAGGWGPSTWLSSIACTNDGSPAVLPSDDRAPILRVLSDANHLATLSDSERGILRAWVGAGAQKKRPVVHLPGWADPRNPRSHVQILRSERWRSMLDPNADGACGQCHDGAPVKPPGVVAAAPGATSCTTCHDQPGGVLACATCHGSSATAAPPRDPCFFPGEASTSGAHRAHVLPGPARAEGLACATCHPTPAADAVLSGVHADGVVNVLLDEKIAGAGARFDAATKSCTTSCHARAGGAHPTPAWTDTTTSSCNTCHSSPPPSHYAGACSDCHRDANADGTGLVDARMHLNGVVDLGDGSGTCGACHGSGDDPWPTKGAHAAHRAPQAAKAVACATCHVVPTAFGTGTGHPRGGPAQVTLTGIASTRNPATFDAKALSCTTWCHGDGITGTTPAHPVWNDTSGASRACGSCHGLPPSAPHIASKACGTCHGQVASDAAHVTNPELHVDGFVEH